MIKFFKTAIITVQSPNDEQSDETTAGLLTTTHGLKYEKSKVGYLDDPLNTDNSWKEIELWHFHYTGPDCLSDSMQTSSVHWRIITEDVFIKLPLSQATLMQDLTHKLQPAIL